MAGSGLRCAVKADGSDPGKPNSNYLQVCLYKITKKNFFYLVSVFSVCE